MEPPAASANASPDDPRPRAQPERETGELGDITQLLQRTKDGDDGARNRLFELVYGQLQQRARAMMAGHSLDHTLQPTALVHEAYTRLFGKKNEVMSFDDRTHFFATAATAMRQVLVDYARYRSRECRSKQRQLPLTEADLERAPSFTEVLEIDEALQSFALDYPDFAQLVELRYFAGMTVEQIASAQQISKRSAEKRWKFSRAWLLKKLSQDPPTQKT